MKRFVIVLAIVFVFGGTATAFAQCGGVERWTIKVGSDKDAASIDLENPEQTDVSSLNQKAPAVKIGSKTVRQDEEKTVYQVHGHIVFYKTEEDKDYHVVIADDTLKYSPGGKGAKPSGHSFIAEIPNPDCVRGKNGKLPKKSYFVDKFKEVRRLFECRFTDAQAQDIDVPVTITGVLFFDVPHVASRQVGRTAHDVEIHPVTDIKFDDDWTCPE